MSSLFDGLVEAAMIPQFDHVYGQPSLYTPRGGAIGVEPIQAILCRGEDRAPEDKFSGQVFEEAMDTIEVRRSEVPEIHRDDIFTLQADNSEWLVDRIEKSDGHHWLCIVVEL